MAGSNGFNIEARIITKRRGDSILKRLDGATEQTLTDIVHESAELQAEAMRLATKIAPEDDISPWDDSHVHTVDSYQVQTIGPRSARIVNTAPQFPYELVDIPARHAVDADELHFQYGGHIYEQFQNKKGTEANEALVRVIMDAPVVTENVMRRRTSRLLDLFR